jgi:peptidoglycan/xylan/chitin deacetylase (PgdA/CDA1 family)
LPDLDPVPTAARARAEPALEPGALRRRLKRLAERGLVTSGVPVLNRVRLRGSALILAYHNVVPEGAEPGSDPGLHLPQRVFAAQMDRLVRTHDVVPLREVLAPARSSRPRVAITFDDGYRGAVTAGVAELAARGLPATIFVAPGLVGDWFWWDALERGRPGAEELHRTALSALGGRARTVRKLFREKGIDDAAIPHHARAATVEELERAAALTGIELGGHSWSHPDLTALAGDELATEVSWPLAWLLSRFRSTTLWFAYPYGRTSDRVVKAVADAGYEGAVCISGGWLRTGSADPYRLPRHNVSADLSRDGFDLRIGGILCR